jgi:hypothetical protein
MFEVDRDVTTAADAVVPVNSGHVDIFHEL